MTKLEGERGAVFVRGDDVMALAPSGIPGMTVVTMKAPGIWFCVKGTPEEVHALLFPEAK